MNAPKYYSSSSNLSHINAPTLNIASEDITHIPNKNKSSIYTAPSIRLDDVNRLVMSSSLSLTVVTDL